MSRKWFLFLFCLSLLILLAPLSRAGLTLHVKESAIRVLFEEQGTGVVLPIENSLGQRVDAHLKLEIIDTAGAAHATVERDYQIKPGPNELTVPVALWLTGKAATDTRELLWYRLRYQIRPASSSQFDQVSNVISLSEITPYIFAVSVAAARKAQEGSAYRVRVKTAHPLTSKAVAGVNIDAEIKFDGFDRDNILLKKSARTDASGFATLDFQIPRNVEDNEGEIKVTARQGILTESAESEIDIDRTAQVMVSTDKPLYQPGQMLHTRVLMFDSSRHALGDQKATLKISDPENTTAFRTELNSSRFGVAGADWPIPDNTRLGDYRVEVQLEDDKHEDSYGATTVKISRYDLPNFTVNVKPDRAYYLPEQDAAVEVNANYLFGQPVKHGHVRVVRETERHWNYRDQKWETEEGDKYEGDVDGEGRFVAQVRLGEEHAKLKDEDYSRYADLAYAAYFTDPTTNRTEQRRFDLRLSKDAIHLYFVGRNYRQARDFPVEFYVSTSYADGTPASCEVAISKVWEEEEARPELPLRTIKTNRYGLAKVSALTLPKDSDEDADASLMFRARDDKGATGKHTEGLNLADKPVVRITTDKALYRDGDPIRAEIVANQSDLTLALDVINEEKVLQSQLVQLQNSRATIVIPYREGFSGAVTLATYAPAPSDDDDDFAYSSRTILYPHDRDLKLKLALNQESYRPGEDASANFLTRTATGRLAESALGVVVFDKAVEERARTDREFGGGYGFYGAYCYLSGCNGEVAGVTRKDLDRVALSKPLPDGLDLVAEVLLTNYGFEPRFFHSERFDANPARAFKDFIEYQIDPLKDRLESEYKLNCDYPKDEAALRRFASTAGIAFDELRDPWETPYRTSFLAQGASDVLEITSAGTDKHFNTADDFTVLRIARPYFRFTGEAVNRGVQRYHSRTGQFIRDAATLKHELRQEGIDFDSLRDPWGEPYRLEFGVSQTKFKILVRSSGPDKRFAPKSDDDVLLWTSSIDYSRALQARIDSAVIAYFKVTSQIPQSDADFNAALKQVGIGRDELRDPWGRHYYATFKQSAVYSNRVSTYSYASYGEKPKEKTELTPVTQQINYIYLRSDGEDAKEGSADDFNVATFSRLIAEQAGNESSPQSVKPGVILPGSTGAITGTVTDPNGAAVVGATVTAKNKRTSIEFSTTTNDEGVYLIRNAPPGLYEVRFSSPGFQFLVITDVPVRSSNITHADARLNLGTVTSTVNVTSEAVTVTAASSQTASIVRSEYGLAGSKGGAGLNQTSTPRLREYFPETLVWQPALETDKQGRAQLKFKLADNITTWKMSVIGSTEDGQIGTVEKEIKAFQPFFVEHDPPRVLTEGDEISLPVVVRNYLDSAQTVRLEIKPERWFALLGPATKSVNVAAGDATRGIFDFRASAPVTDGKQQITATASKASDAIEKPVTVHPDGEEKSLTASDVVSDHGAVTLNLPQTAIPNSMRAELKIYPNLLAHVAESVEAIMERPYGCGEQTISSTYPSLLWLKYYKSKSADGKSALPATEPDMRVRAERYLRAGYARLLNYQDESGGFTYWGRGDPDIALTAYALRFLGEARELIAVDAEVMNRARAWLIKQQCADGSWAAYDYGDKLENQRRTAMLTAYVARVLAMTADLVKIDGPSNKSAQQPLKRVVPELKHALDYLATRIDEIDEPYLIASYALAAIEVDEAARAEKAVAKLRALVNEENNANYWSLETNTPFYGWGLAGRVETTALVVQALARYRSEPEAVATGPAAKKEDAGEAPALPLTNKLIRGGLLFLLREKDRYGVWYSTQATINVLDALLVLLGRDVNTASDAPRSAEIMVNGRSVKSIEMPAPNRPVSPITIDLSQLLTTGANRVELKRARGSSPASVQAVAIYYLPWRESVATQEANWRANGSSGLRLVTKFDQTESKVSAEINCHVEAERVGFRGHGMMLAEIGLPPGADVDRASLEQAMKGSDWTISQYDILPDRVVVYLWPRAGGTKFDFKFRPRFGLNAQTAASLVYDYYNPEARTIVAPTRFVVR
jgi:hypothetical protein